MKIQLWQRKTRVLCHTYSFLSVCDAEVWLTNNILLTCSSGGQTLSKILRVVLTSTIHRVVHFAIYFFITSTWANMYLRFRAKQNETQNLELAYRATNILQQLCQKYLNAYTLLEISRSIIPINCTYFQSSNFSQIS